MYAKGLILVLSSSQIGEAEVPKCFYSYYKYIIYCKLKGTRYAQIRMIPLLYYANLIWPTFMTPEVLTINDGCLSTQAAAPFIFLAEDDIDDQELFVEAISLHNQSIQIRSVSNGRKAISVLESLPASSLPCLIVLDYNLPEADGAQILNFLSQQDRYHLIPKIVWSTSNSPVYREACLQLGAKAYFTKPTDVSGITALAKEMLSLCDGY